MSSISSKFLYRYFGPTTAHLQSEFVLLGIMCLFTSASICTMYHANEYLLFGSAMRSVKSECNGCHWNEITYIILSTAFLGRHLVQRIICTTEANTSTSSHGRIEVCPQQQPSMLSSMYRIWIWICFGGQYFDIPSCPIQLTLHGGQSPSLNTLTYSAASSTSDSGGAKSKLYSTFRNIFQTGNMTSPVVRVVDHHHHRTMNKHNNENLINRKTPPLHRTFVVQVLFIVPVIVVPISITKFIMRSLRSRKGSTRGYYDSDDDEDSDRKRKRRHSNNQWAEIDNAKNSDLDAFDYDDENLYIKIHIKTQNQVNAHLDTVWKYVPPAQFVLFFLTLSTFAFVGLKFHTSSMNSLTGSGNVFKGNKRFGYENYAKYNNPGMNQGYQPYFPNVYPGEPTTSANNFGSQSTILNAELMAQRFEMKQRQLDNDIGGKNALHHSMSLILNQFSQYAVKIHMNTWKSTYYSPWGMFYMMSLWGVVASLVLFGRMVLPIPDLTARGRESWVGKGTNKSNKQKRKEKSWTENYMSITTGNRLNLHFKVMIVRICEYVIVCAIIPQSLFMCKATGHCNIEPTVFEVGDPTLIQSRSGGQVLSMFDNLIYDHLVANFITFSVMVTSLLMLLGQVVVLDRSSLSLEAHNYVQGISTGTGKVFDSSHKRGWKKFNSSFGNESHKFRNDNLKTSGNTHSSIKKWMLFANIKNAVYECFSLEIGALSTSQTLCYIFYAYTVHALIIVLLAIFYCSTGRDWYPLILVLFAVFTAAGGSDVDTADFDELHEIAREINVFHGQY